MKYIKREIVMLPAEKASELTIFKSKYGLFRGSLIDIKDFNRGDKYFKPQHLYFLSDEEIKEGDAVLHDFGMGWEIENPCDIDNLKSNTRFKIIATTDESLKISKTCIICDGNGEIVKCTNIKQSNFKCNHCNGRGSVLISLPRPSNKFLKKYCELGGIDEALVEYETIQTTKKEDYQYQNGTSNLCYTSRPKVAPDNTITIKPFKEKVYYKEELIGSGKGSLDYYLLNNPKVTQEERETIMEAVNSWIEENL